MSKLREVVLTNRSLAVAFGVNVALLLAGCDPTPTAVIDGIAYCVPSRYLVRESRVTKAWLDRSSNVIDTGGFVFEIELQDLPDGTKFVPRSDVRGQPMPIIGHVRPADPQNRLDRAGRRPDDPKIVYYTGPKSIIEFDQSGRFAAAYEDGERARWVVWDVPGAHPPTREAMIESGKVIAMCSDWSRPYGGEGSPSCTRNAYMGEAWLSYSTAAANIGSIEELDAAMFRKFSQWRCK